MSARIAYDSGALAFDLVHDGTGLEDDEGLESAMILSTFCDATATPEQLALYGKDPEDRRGFWGDAYPEVEGDVWGSLLWLLEGLPAVQQTLDDAKRFVEEANQWLVDDGIVASTGIWTEAVDMPDGSVILGIGFAPVRVEGAVPVFQQLYAATTGEPL